MRYSVGIGYVHFKEPDLDGFRPLDEIGYIDVGLHPVFGSTLIPEELDLVIRNDNAGENSLTTLKFSAILMPTFISITLKTGQPTSKKGVNLVT